MMWNLNLKLEDEAVIDLAYWMALNESSFTFGSPFH